MGHSGDMSFGVPVNVFFGNFSNFGSAYENLRKHGKMGISLLLHGSNYDKI